MGYLNKNYQISANEKNIAVTCHAANFFVSIYYFWDNSMAVNTSVDTLLEGSKTEKKRFVFQ